VVTTGTQLFGLSVTATPASYVGYTHNPAHPLAVPSGVVGENGLALHLYYVANSYTLSYNANNATAGLAPAPQVGDYQSTVNVAGQGNLLRAGYSFLGWSEDTSAIVQSYGEDDSITLSRDYTLYAVWSLDPVDDPIDDPVDDPTDDPIDDPVVTPPVNNPTYSVTYASGTTDLTVIGLPAAASRFTSGASVTVGAAPTRSGYTFSGWASSQGGTLQPGATFVMPAANVTFTATWEVLTVTVAPEPGQTANQTPSSPNSPATSERSLPPAAVESFSPVEQEMLVAQTGNPVLDIFNGNVPLGNFVAQGVWSLLSLLLVVLALLSALFVVAPGFISKRLREQRRGILGLVSAALAVIALLLWLLLDTLANPMAWINSNTLYVVIVFALYVVVAIAYLALRKSRRDESDSDADGGEQ
jgi:uncharacterized repeat protein (TIGR02543 family)